MLITPIILPISPSISMVVFGLLLKGIGAGPLISCSYTGCLKATKESDKIEESKAYTLASTIISFSIPLGNFFGGLSAPVMFKHWGMPFSSSAYMTVFSILAVACAYLDRKIVLSRGTKYQRLDQIDF